MDGVVKGDPVPKGTPPVATLYQFKVDPPEELAVRFTVPGPQRVAPAELKMDGLFTVTVTVVDTVVPPKLQFTLNR